MTFSDHLILLRAKEKKYNIRINILIISLQLLQPLLQLFSVLQKKKKIWRFSWIVTYLVLC